MQNVLALETNKYSIKLENFEGPLDLLCHLIDKNKMDIYDIKISDITDQYIEYIRAMEDLNLEVTSEFLIMASTLTYIKSKNLLPSQEDEEKELSEEELIKRIIEYKKFKEVSKILKEFYEENYKKFFKKTENINLPKQDLEKEYSKEVIIDMYKQVIELNAKRLNQNAKNIEKIAITESYTIADKVKVMYRELIKNKKFKFNNLFSNKTCNKKEIVTAFMGLLEMSKRSKVSTQQYEIFGEITVEKNKKNV